MATPSPQRAHKDTYAMMLDDLLQFSNGQAITATAASTNTLDLLTSEKDTTTFTLLPNSTWGNATYFGMDLGIGPGQGDPQIVIHSGTAAFATLTSLNIQFQGAPNNATAQASGNISDLTFVTYIETGTIGVALLTASTQIARFAWPKRQVAAALPRFVRLNYVVAGSNATAGSLTADVTLAPDDAVATLGQYPSGYKVAG
jgi:hypothetical protein